MTTAKQLKARKRDLILRYARPSDVKGFTQLFTTLAPLTLAWLAAIWSTRISYWLTASLIVMLALVNARVFALLHDCGHGGLFRTRWLNRWVGFGLGVLTGMPQYVWSQHHDFHHRTNGDWDRYRGTMTTLSTDEYAALSEVRRRLYRLKCSVAIVPLVGFIYLIFNPRFNWMKGSLELVVHLVRAKVSQPRVALRVHAAAFQTRYWATFREYRHQCANNAVLLSGWALLCSLIGPGHFFLIYLTSLSLAGGVGVVLFTVQHNFEHAYASSTEQWNADVGTLEGTSFLVLPAWLNWFTANIGYHHIHHMSAAIPNYCLVDCHRESEDLFVDVPRIRLRDVPGALKCILWDKPARRIISVAEYEQQRAAAATDRLSTRAA